MGQVLWAFYFAWCALDVDEVIGWTGLKRETCYYALKSLEGDFLGTQALAHGRKVWFLKSEMLPILHELATRAGDIQVIDANYEKSTELLDVSGKRTPGGESVVVVESKLNSPTITTTTTTISDQESGKRTPAKWAALKVVLDEYQIIGKRRKDLIACDWIDAAYVRACVEYAKAEPANWNNPVGMAITRMLEHVMSPAMRENGHPENCRCTKCKTDDGDGFKRYTEGAYANWINNRDDEEHDEECACQRCRRDFPERFCQFTIVHESQRTSRTNTWREWTSRCGRLLKPGQKYCDEHEEIKDDDETDQGD